MEPSHEHHFQVDENTVPDLMTPLYTITVAISETLKAPQLLYSCGYIGCEYGQAGKVINAPSVTGDDWTMLINFGVQHHNDHVELDKLAGS